MSDLTADTVLNEQNLRDYFENNENLKQAKKTYEKMNGEIKQALNVIGKDDVQHGEYKASRRVQERNDGMDEEKLVAILEEMGLEEALETVKRPREDVLQKMIYEGRIPASALEGCVNIKKVEVLTVRKVKVKDGKSDVN